MAGSDGMRAIMLAGGKGTRLAPYTTVLPKPLLPIGDLPVAEILIRQLVEAGVTRITLAVGHLAGILQAYFGDGSRWNVSIDYSLEEEPRGTAGPIALIDGLDETFVVVNGDLLTTLDFRAMVQHHRDAGAIATVGTFKRTLRLELGILELNDSEQITGYIEKPDLTFEVSVGAYVMEPGVLDRIPRDRAFDLPDLIRDLIAAEQKVQGYRFDGHWHDIGRPEDYEEAIELFQREPRVFLGSDT